LRRTRTPAPVCDESRGFPADRIELYQAPKKASHMGAADFRVGGHIFATLASQKQGYGNLMLTPELQAEFVGEQPNVFAPIAGGWGTTGATLFGSQRRTKTYWRAHCEPPGSYGSIRTRARENDRTR